jgi:hypothetical protein
MVRHILLISLAGIFLSVMPTSAAAGVIVYNDLASFQAATTGLTDVNFNGIAPSGSFVYSPTPPGFTRSGVTFNITNALPGDGLDVTARNYYSPTIYPNDFLIPSFSPRATTVESITLPSGATAVGLDLGTFLGGALTFSFSTGDQYVDSSAATFGSTSFLGFTSSAPITSLTIGYVNANEALVIDDFQFGAAIVPEPSTVTLAGLGILGWLGYVWRRRRRGKGVKSLYCT